MQLKLDVKTLVVGMALGFIITIAIGAGGGAGEADFGIAVEARGSALVKTQDGSLYIVEPDRAVAEIVEYASGPFEGDFFTLSRPIPTR
jgi:hypothetical protein